MRVSRRSSGDPATTAHFSVSTVVGQPRTITLLWVYINSLRMTAAISLSISRKTPVRPSLKRQILSHWIPCSTNSMITYSINGSFMRTRLTLALGKWGTSRKSPHSRKMKTRRWKLIPRPQIMVGIMTTLKSSQVHLRKGSLSSSCNYKPKQNEKPTSRVFGI